MDTPESLPLDSSLDFNYLFIFTILDREFVFVPQRTENVIIINLAESVTVIRPPILGA